jgi:hypothetical protein
LTAQYVYVERRTPDFFKVKKNGARDFSSCSDWKMGCGQCWLYVERH